MQKACFQCGSTRGLERITLPCWWNQLKTGSRIHLCEECVVVVPEEEAGSHIFGRWLYFDDEKKWVEATGDSPGDAMTAFRTKLCNLDPERWKPETNE